MQQVTQINFENAPYQLDSQTATKGAPDDYQTFLRMLTTQIQNQDPLSPMEGTDFAVQLATFSGVEQQTKTNQILAAILEHAQGGGLSQLSSWIGKSVRTTSEVSFTGDPIRVYLEPDANADQAYLIAIDPYGREVARNAVGPETGDVLWRGLSANDGSALSGRYLFRISSHRDGVEISSRPAETYAKVIGAERVGATGRLILEGGTGTNIEDVFAIFG
ncbi:flagellar hook capping FlgD N-terminal domain-containing protein [Paracoccus sp. (in: a-proteobacteria)]|uniref:flagellar hook capping FlgD N-terminal domain-containing protein n=1 Tax=Paracoccus sp. TaxID=267 RepID=UPI0028A1E440|nr:flagellar hook capping FlgD N-terminal domain-containing protein [Paracoccus sp. (in: a-proteobacteria)]